MSEADEVQDVKKSKGKVVSPSDPLNPVGIRLGEDLRATLEAEAEERGISLGEICRELIQDGVKDNPRRQQNELLRSVAITKQQLTRLLEKEPHGLFRSRRYLVMRRIISDLEDLERTLGE